MKYTVLINQYGAHASGLIGKTDFNDWAIVEYIRDFYSNPASRKFDDHVWINYGHLLQEMPLMTLNKKSSVSNRMRKIEGLGLVTTLKDEDGKLYAKLTTKAYHATTAKAVPTQEHPVPTQEHPVPEKVHRTDHHLTDHQEQVKDTPKPPQGAEAKNITDQAFDYFWQNMKTQKKNKPAAKRAFAKSIKGKSDNGIREFVKMVLKDQAERKAVAGNGDHPFNKLHPATYLNNQRWEDDPETAWSAKPGFSFKPANQPATIPHDMPIDEDGDIDVIELARRKIAARQESIEMFGF